MFPTEVVAMAWATLTELLAFLNVQNNLRYLSTLLYA